MEEGLLEFVEGDEFAREAVLQLPRAIFERGDLCCHPTLFLCRKTWETEVSKNTQRNGSLRSPRCSLICLGERHW